LTLVQLEYIVALDNYRHFAVAAEKCFVTQPTLSIQIQKLEDTLSVIIFDRSKHPVEPTEIGLKIIDQARLILSESKKIGALIDDEKHEIRGEIKIGVLPTLAPYLIPLFVSPFVEKYPLTSLQVSEFTTDTLISNIKNDQVDVGLLISPIQDPELVEYSLFYEPFFVYVSHRHPLYKNQTIDPEGLQTDGLWLLNEGHCFRNQTLNICHTDLKKQSNNRVLYESGSLEALKKMVDKRGGFTLLPELFMLDMSKDDKSKVRSFKDPVPTREVSMVVKKSFMKKNLLEALHKEILNCLPPILATRKSTNVIKFR